MGLGVQTQVSFLLSAALQMVMGFTAENGNFNEEV